MTPLGSILSHTQVLGREISVNSLGGARGAMPDALRAQVRAPGLARALLACSRRPPHPVHPCSFSRSLVARAPCAGRVRVVRDVWKAPGASAAAGGALRAATGLWEAHEWPIRPNLTKSTAQTFLLFGAKSAENGALPTADLVPPLAAVALPSGSRRGRGGAVGTAGQTICNQTSHHPSSGRGATRAVQ